MPLPAGHPPFSSFSSFHGVRAAKPLLYWLECRFVIFAIFVKNPFFWRDKSTVYQKHRFRDPDYMNRCFVQVLKISSLQSAKTCSTNLPVHRLFFGLGSQGGAWASFDFLNVLWSPTCIISLSSLCVFDVVVYYNLHSHHVLSNAHKLPQKSKRAGRKQKNNLSVCS